MILDRDIRDELIFQGARLVRLGNGARAEMGPAWEEMALRWVTQTVLMGDPKDMQPRHARGSTLSILGAGIAAHERAIRILRDFLVATGRVHAGMVVRILRRNYRRAFKEQVDIGDLETGAAIHELSAEMADVVDNLDIRGVTLAEFSDQLLARNESALRRLFRLAAVEGWRPHRLTSEVRKQAQVARWHADAMARTGIMRISNEVNRRIYRANTDIIKREEYIATLDTRTCLACASYDRQTFDVGEGPSLPLHINCRCIYTPITRTWRELGIDADEISPASRAAMDGPVAGETSFPSWLKRQSTARQREVLGASRFQLYQAGTPIHRFVDDGRILTLQQLARRGLVP